MSGPRQPLHEGGFRPGWDSVVPPHLQEPGRRALGQASRLSGMIWLLLLVTLLALMAHFAARQTRLNLVPDQAGVPRRPNRLDSRPRHPA